MARTTSRRDRFDWVLQGLRRRVPDLTQRITICAATSQRQQEAEKLSGEADVMVVVGGKNSSNTQKLLETCRLRCKRSILVETPEDVPQNLAKADDRVALTAGETRQLAVPLDTNAFPLVNDAREPVADGTVFAVYSWLSQPADRSAALTAPTPLHLSLRFPSFI